MANATPWPKPRAAVNPFIAAANEDSIMIGPRRIAKVEGFSTLLRRSQEYKAIRMAAGDDVLGSIPVHQLYLDLTAHRLAEGLDDLDVHPLRLRQLRTGHHRQHSLG